MKIERFESGMPFQNLAKKLGGQFVTFQGKDLNKTIAQIKVDYLTRSLI